MNGFNFLQSLATKGGTYSPLRAFSFRLSQVCFESCEQMDAVLLRFRLIRRLRSNVKMLIIVIIIIIFSLFLLLFLCALKIHNGNICACLYVGSCCCKVYLLHIQTYLFSSLSAVVFFLNRVFVWFFFFIQSFFDRCTLELSYLYF